jgi:putative Ca2+/H+ antiporter (TMEM165/GDT1 family)
MVAETLLVAKLGDKTMLPTVTLATGGASLIGVWLASTLGVEPVDAVPIVGGGVTVTTLVF